MHKLWVLVVGILLIACTTTVPAPTATPTSTPTVTPTPEPLDLKALICSYPWPCNEALNIVYGPTSGCPNGESRGDPNALGDYGLGDPGPNSFGLFQIYYPVHYAVVGPDPYALLDPEFNVRIAYGIYTDAIRYWNDGWRPWTCPPYIPRFIYDRTY